MSLSHAYGLTRYLTSRPSTWDGVIILGSRNRRRDRGGCYLSDGILTSEQAGISTVAVDNVRGARLAAGAPARPGTPPTLTIAGPSAGWPTRRCADSAMSRRARPTTSNPSSFSLTLGLRDGYDVMRAAGRLPQGFRRRTTSWLGAMRYIYERGSSAMCGTSASTTSTALTPTRPPAHDDPPAL